MTGLHNRIQRGLVSVIIPTHNSARFIDETIQSVLAQTYSNIEIIVVDDCSTDDTVRRVRILSDSRIKASFLTKNVGAGEARNSGIDAASGQYLAFLDSDDVWVEEKLSQQIESMRVSHSAISYTHYSVVSEAGHVITDERNMPSYATYDTLLKWCFIRTSTVLVDRLHFDRDIRFPPLRKRQDFGYFLNLLRDGQRATLLPQLLCSYRMRPGSVSSNKLSNIRYNWAIYYDLEKLGYLRSAWLLGMWGLRSGLTWLRRLALEQLRRSQ